MEDANEDPFRSIRDSYWQERLLFESHGAKAMQSTGHNSNTRYISL